MSIFAQNLKGVLCFNTAEITPNEPRTGNAV